MSSCHHERILNEVGKKFVEEYNAYRDVCSFLANYLMFSTDGYQVLVTEHDVDTLKILFIRTDYRANDKVFILRKDQLCDLDTIFEEQMVPVL